MKLTTFILIIALAQVSAKGFGQRITLSENNSPMEKVLQKITQQSGYNFFYNDNDIAGKTVNLDIRNASLDEVMARIMNGLSLDYRITKNNISITKRPEPSLLDKFIARIKANEVSGTVTDESGRPLAGASVKIKSSGRGITTDVRGAFKLMNVDEDAIIVISYLGYKTKEIAATADLGIIRMEPSDSKLDEVQIVAYGQTSQRLSTGNITTVTAKDIEKSPVSNPLIALQGRVTGMTIVPSSGNANSNVTVRIQGTNSLIRGNDPFYVIDGVPYSSEYINALALPGANKLGSPMSFINPDDIESISILKDADATAIYGSRAANGAILITTKKGKPGAMKVNLNIRQGFSEQSNWLKLMNTAQYLEMRKEAIKNDGGTVGDGDYDVNGFWDNNSNDHDWQKELAGGKAAHSTYNLDLSGGTDQTTYAIGATYRKNGTIYIGDFSDRTAALHFNLDSRSKNQRFQVTLSGNYLNNLNSLPVSDMATYALLLPPNAPQGYNADGSVNWAPNSSGSTTFGTNPYATLLQTYRGRTTNLVSNMLLRYELTKGLQFKTSLGYNEMNADASVKIPLDALAPEVRPYALNTTVFTDGRQKNWIVEPQLTYQWAGKLGTVNALLGGSIQQRQDFSSQVEASGFLSPANMDNIASATQIVPYSSGTTDYKYTGVFAQLNYNYQERYLLNLSGRRDGSSRFGAGNKFHNFGAIGLGWVFSQESFLKTLSWLSFGKLRLSYGTTGSDQIGDYTYLSLYNPINVGVPYGGLSSVGTSRVANPQLQWEETTKSNIGLDLGFWKDRLLLTANYFRNRSGNQIQFLRPPSFVGSTSVTRNIPAEIQNTGLELALTGKILSGNDFKWSSNLNFYIPKNKLVRFDNLENSVYASNYIIGQSLDWRRLYEFAGVNPQTGAYQFKGADGNLTETPIEITDQQKIVSLGQRLTAGMENTLSYKQFSLSFLLRYVRQVGENTGISPLGAPPGFPGYNALSATFDRWQAPGQNAPYARFNSNGEFFGNLGYYRSSDATISNASFMRLENVSLSYNLPDLLIKNLHLGSARVYFEGQNLWNFTGYKGLDPETLSSLSAPILRTLTLGLQVGF